MFLFFATLQEFTLFLKIVLWIAVPITVVSLTIATILHYRRKRRRAAEGELEAPLEGEETAAANVEADIAPVIAPAVAGVTTTETSSLPDWLASSDPDNKTLVKKYEHELRYFREKNHSLEEDYRNLEYKYETLLAKAYRGEKSESDELLNSIRKENSEYRNQVTGLKDQLSQLEVAHAELLKTSGTAHASAGNNAITADGQLTEAKGSEQKYLRDLVEEEKLHISFLQQQLDQRIRSYHEMEEQVNEMSEKVAQMKSEIVTSTESLSLAEETIEAKNMETEQQRKVIEGYLEQIRHKEETIGAKTEYISHLEKSIAELQEHHNQSLHLLNATSQEVSELADQLTERSAQVADLQEKLTRNNGFLNQLKAQIVDQIEPEEAPLSTHPVDKQSRPEFQPQESFS